MLKKGSKTIFNEEVRPLDLMQELQQLQKQKQYRQEKAAAKFSKERFLRSSEPEPLRSTTPEPSQPNRRTMQDKLKVENLKFDLMACLKSQVPFLQLRRAWISMTLSSTWSG